MGIQKLPPEIIQAVQDAVAWFDRSKLHGIRIEKIRSPSVPGGWDKIVVKDIGAEPMWARFYGISDNQPMFCSRDGMPRATLAAISPERRNGYEWLGYFATNLLANDYPAWLRKHAIRENVLKNKV